MSMSDPIADMLTRVRNAQAVNKKTVTMPKSNIKVAICDVLLSEGYITGMEVSDDNRTLSIDLKYYQDKPVIEKIARVSRPGLRTYVGKDDIPSVIGGLGIVIVSTSKGVMSGSQAQELNVGGEVLCQVY